MHSLEESLDLLSMVETPYFSLDNQSTHRLNIFQSWLKVAHEHNYDLESNIIGKKTLDIGCGQGDMIALFAATLKAQGNNESKVIGVDPANLDYGKPWTLGEAQSLLAGGPLAEFLSFRQLTAPEIVVSHPKGTYSVVYFAHSLYYFPSSTTLIQTFKALLDAGIKTLLLAEWALSISQPAALPHLLAVLLQSIDPLPEGNVRTVLSPAAYLDAAKQAGWELVGGRTFTPEPELEDGRWETKFARLVAAQDREIEKRQSQINGERSAESVRLESIRAHSDALEVSIPSGAGLDGVECMDVWTAVFRPARW